MLIDVISGKGILEVCYFVPYIFLYFQIFIVSMCYTFCSEEKGKKLRNGDLHDFDGVVLDPVLVSLV